MPHATFRRDAPTVSFYHVPGNSQAEATAATARANEVSFRTGTVGFIKAFKDARQLFWPDTYACITDIKTLCLSTCLLCRANCHFTTGRSEFDGIVHKIDEHARNLFAISRHQYIPFVDFRAQCNAMALRLWQHTRHDFSYQVFCLYRLDNHRHKAGFDT
jgi:hypothetical protein